MRLDGRDESENIEDRRGTRIRGGAVGGAGGIGAIVLALVAMYFGVDPSVFLGPQSGTAVTTEQVPHEESASEAQARKLVAVVLADTERTWGELLPPTGHRYEEPTLVLFSEAVESACGLAQSAVGPFYCAQDRKVYIDLSFYEDLKDRFGAPGDFAQAYVVAHEVGHHVQNLLGISERMSAARSRGGEAQANAISVKLELQADCFAGIWAHHASQSRQLLESGDVEEGLRAASAIGDDRLQMQSRGYVSPESFTHGSSAQRVHWFKRGLESGDLGACNP